MTTPKRWGAEFVLNTTTTSDQSMPHIVALADGRFVAAWEDHSQTGEDASGAAIRAQLFDADGGRSGAEFLVNSTTTASQSQPALAALADGRFVALWTDESATGGDTSGAAVRGQVFNADGTRSGREFVVNSATGDWQFQPAVTALADGRFVVGWSDYSQSGGDTSAWAVRAQLFEADGAPAGDELLVNSTTSAEQSRPTIARLADGRFVVAWQDNSQTGGDTSGLAVRAQMFNADGTRSGGEFLVNSTTNGWQLQPAVTALADGGFVVAWDDVSQTGADTSGFAVRAQVFHADGAPSGSEFLVNTTTSELQVNPTVTALADGRFAVAWQDTSATGGDASESAVRGQIFDPRLAAVRLNGTFADDAFVGTLFGDWVSGSSGGDKLWGGAGDDQLRGQEGDDRLLGQDGHDELLGGEGDDTLNGGAGDDRLEGGTGDDTYVLASPGDMVLEGSERGTDRVKASVSFGLGANVENLRLKGDDPLSGTGNALDNAVTGNAGDNTLSGRGGADRLDGGASADRLKGGAGRDALHGDSGKDKLWGRGGDDRLDGDAGADRLHAGTGRDRLHGASGKDELYGGVDRAGDDFVFTSRWDSAVGKNPDIIHNFTRGSDDVDLRGVDARASTEGANGTFEWAGKTPAAHSVWWKVGDDGVLLRADVTGDSTADFEVLLAGLRSVGSEDVLL